MPLVIARQELLLASKKQILDLKGTDFSLCVDAHFQFEQRCDYLPFSLAAAHLLFQVIAMHYEKKAC